MRDHLDRRRSRMVIHNTGLLAPPRCNRHRLPLVVDENITDSLATALILTVAPDGARTGAFRLICHIVLTLS